MDQEFDIHKAAGLIIVNMKLLLEKSGGKNVYVSSTPFVAQGF